MTSQERYWVVGGDFASMEFRRLRDGASMLAGPFETRDEAAAEWRRLSDEARGRATARYSIAAEQIVLPS